MFYYFCEVYVGFVNTSNNGTDKDMDNKLDITYTYYVHERPTKTKRKIKVNYVKKYMGRPMSSSGRIWDYDYDDIIFYKK